ncbi:hypothetical protein HYT54_04995, partial [Candidatus Woesearchaeota archaeon]|nr:hypothetical protein [Candidatus Woesearchaeota archaeon]
MSLAEFFGKIKKGEYDKRPIEQILADLNEAMKKSKYDKTLLEEIDELIRYLDGHLDAKHGLVSQLTAVASGLESTQPSAFHERLAEIMKELNGLRQELAAYVKEEDRRQERIHASIHGKAREGIDKIRETFSTFVRVMNENKRFFSKLRLPQSLSSKEIMDKIAQLESSIIAAESHSGKLEEKVAEFEHKLEREHEILSEMLIRVYNLTSKSAAKKAMARESTERNTSRRVKARESTGDLRIFLAKKSKEFSGIIEGQRNSIREIEDVVGGNMLNVFDEIYNLIVGIYYELARILNWSQEQRREMM